jgi:plasmid stabilization system protein ParE
MEFFWHPEAVAEADAAADFYHNKQRELARRFINNLDEALDRIAIKPGIYCEVAADIRKRQHPRWGVLPSFNVMGYGL